ncbi:MAG: amylo-alpha-1,6-glucosidase, partial [Chloroflexota bacterium]|nr:amylo-alpha-1,6-glucosidase [Chloroflexota bacterium]
LEWELDADFADLIEARSGKRQQEAPIEKRWEGTTLRYNYAHPHLARGASIGFEARGAPLRYEDGRVKTHLQLPPQGSHHFCLQVSPIDGGAVLPPHFGCDAFGSRPTETDRQRAAWVRECTRLYTPNPDVQKAWDRAVHDLGALAVGPTMEGGSGMELAVPMAGEPLYGTLFGRDALTLAGQAMFFSPRLAEGALRLLARYVGTKDDDFYDEQPGRIPQQVRDGPLGLLGITPWLHDYGDYAAPCAFLVLLAGHHIAAGDTEVTRRFLDPARRVLDWLDTRADLDGDGFLEYKTRSPRGQKHQGWKDSGDPVRYPDGSEVEPPVAACEIQGYWYAAKLLMAEVFLARGEPSRAFDLLRQAQALKKRFNDAFWMPAEKFLAFGLDADKKQIKTIASNAGHCLTTGILDRKHAADVVKRLMQPDMFSGWGIRTLSSEHPAYNPIKYHLGSVWPVENATFALGMKRFGFSRECNAIARGMFDAAALFEHHRLPETMGGFPRDKRHPHPGVYPDACAPQGWSASAIAWLVQAMLGIFTYAPANLLVLDPVLPAWLPGLTLRDLPVGESRVSIRFRRQRDGTTDYKVLERKGTVRVIRQAPPDALNVGLGTRLGQLAQSVLPWR